MSGVLAVVDEVALLFEPNAAKRDGKAARPVEYLPDTLYVWARTERFATEGDGSLDDERFALRVAWLTDASHEVAAGERNRATSEAIHAKVEALAALVRANRTGSSYEQLAAEGIDYESAITHAARGFYMDLNGYQLRS